MLVQANYIGNNKFLVFSQKGLGEKIISLPAEECENLEINTSVELESIELSNQFKLTQKPTKKPRK